MTSYLRGQGQMKIIVAVVMLKPRRKKTILLAHPGSRVRMEHLFGNQTVRIRTGHYGNNRESKRQRLACIPDWKAHQNHFGRSYASTHATSISTAACDRKTRKERSMDAIARNEREDHALEVGTLVQLSSVLGRIVKWAWDLLRNEGQQPGSRASAARTQRQGFRWPSGCICHAEAGHRA